MKTSVSVIIPSYNESTNILPVIKAVQGCQLVSEIIVVDDGSAPDSHRILTKIKNIKLITHPHNLGKSAAMKTGLLASKSDWILYCDADLHNLKSSHFSQIINPVYSGQYDIILVERARDLWLNKISGNNAAFGGERLIRRSLLFKNFDIFNYHGYLIEGAFNLCFLGQYTAAKVSLKNVYHYHKYRKWGFRGIYSDYKMLRDIFLTFGFKNLIWQINEVRKLPYLNS